MVDKRNSRRRNYMLASLDGIKSIGGIIAGGSVIGGFFSAQFGTLAGLLGIAIGLGVQQLCAFGIAMLASYKYSPPTEGDV